MPIRLSGIASGMDTDAIIKELMSAQSMKKTKIEQKKTKLDWKQEKWAELNTKIYKLYTDQISKLRLAGSYAAKATTSSNDKLVTATAGTSAGAGTHTIRVLGQASAQYVTGVKVPDITETDKEGNTSTKKVTGKSTLVGDLKMEAGTIIKVTNGKGDNATYKTLEITDKTTLGDVVNMMKEAGLNASFDEGQGRFFINGKDSGEENAFSIQTYKRDSEAANKLAEVEDRMKKAGFTEKQISEYRALIEDLQKKEDAYNEDTYNKTAKKAYDEAVKKVADMETALYAAAGKKVEDDWLAANGSAIEDTVKTEYYDADGNILADKRTEAETEVKDAAIEKALREEAIAKVGDQAFDDDAKKQEAIDKAYEELKAEYEADTNPDLKAKVQEKIDEAVEAKVKENYEAKAAEKVEKDLEAYMATDEAKQLVADGKAIVDEYKPAVGNYSDAIAGVVADDSNVIEGHLDKLGLANIKDGKVTETVAGMPVVKESGDAKIELDGAELVGTSNSFTVAGVTYEIKGMDTNETVTINVTNDTKAVYDMVKNFVKEYNALLKEMNSLYGADSARGYEPLTDEEKEAMSEKQIEMWENKIKGSLLRRDETLNSLMTTMRSSLQTSVRVNGRNYSLSTFGIGTGDYTEKGLLHISGDKEDSTVAEKADKLTQMLNENPEDTAEALSQIMGNLYGAMQEKMKGTSVSSALTFYNDKEMKKQATNYSKQITTWEKRLQDMENRYYKQFSAMETAMAKLQSQSNYLTSMMGG